MIFHIYSPRFFHWIEIGARKPAAWKMLSMSNIPSINWQVFMQKGNTGSYVYAGWWSVWWTGTYSMVLSKAAFFHKKYFSLYTNEMPASIREFTTKNRFLVPLINLHRAYCLPFSSLIVELHCSCILFLPWILVLVHQELWRYCNVIPCCKCDWFSPYMGER